MADAVINPVWRGYAWSQAFAFPAGFFEAGDAMICDVKTLVGGLVVALPKDGEGLEIDGDQLFMTVDAEDTARITANALQFGFVLMRSGQPIPIGMLVTVPVVDHPTGPRS